MPRLARCLHRRPAATTPRCRSGRMASRLADAGSFTRRGLATFTIATACCCRLCSHPLGPCYTRKAGHTLVHGCQQCRANQHSPSPRRPCSSRCGAACVYPCRLAQTVAAPAPVVGSRSTSTGTMPSLAPARGCWLAERKSSSGLGCAWPARRSDQMGKSSLNNGSCAQPHRECQLTTADGSTSRLDLVVYGATPRGGALCCDATFISPLARTGHPQPGAAETDGAERRKRSTYPELCSGGPQELVVLGSEVGGRWNGEAGRFVQHLLRVRSQRAPPRDRRGLVAPLVGHTPVCCSRARSVRIRVVDGGTIPEKSCPQAFSCGK